MRDGSFAVISITDKTGHWNWRRSSIASRRDHRVITTDDDSGSTRPARHNAVSQMRCKAQRPGAAHPAATWSHAIANRRKDAACDPAFPVARST